MPDGPGGEPVCGDFVAEVRLRCAAGAPADAERLLRCLSAAARQAGFELTGVTVRNRAAGDAAGAGWVGIRAAQRLGAGPQEPVDGRR